MKNTIKKLIAAMAILAALSPLRALAAVTVYAEDIQTNDAAATKPGMMVHRGGEPAVEKLMVVKVITILAVFGMPVAIVAIIFFFRHRRIKMAHETLRVMIEKGATVTPELVAELRGRGALEPPTGRGNRGLLPGLVLAGIGTALLISGSRGDHKGGAIVLFIGIAFLIVWFVERKSQNNVQPPR